MTLRARLACYAVAVLCGSFFVALVYYAPAFSSWSAEGRPVWGFLLVYVMSLVSGFPAWLLYAFTLSRVTAALRWHHALQWVAAGGVIGLAVPWLFARLGYLLEGTYFTAEWQWLKAVLVFPFMGPMMYTAQPVWPRLSVAVATAWLMNRCVRRLSGAHGRR